MASRECDNQPTLRISRDQRAPLRKAVRYAQFSPGLGRVLGYSSPAAIGDAVRRAVMRAANRAANHEHDPSVIVHVKDGVALTPQGELLLARFSKGNVPK